MSGNFGRSHQPAGAGGCSQGDCWDVVGDKVTCLIPGSTTNGAFSVVEIICPPGGGPPPHIHHSEDELFQVVEGEFEVRVGDQVRTLTVGQVAAGLRGIPHSYRNVAATPGRLMVTLIPAGFENFFREVHSRRISDSPEALIELGAQYQLTFLPPKD